MMVMRILAQEGEVTEPNEPLDFSTPLYLEAADFEAADGRGIAYLTRDIHKAQRFDGIQTLFAYWKRIPMARQWRPDGKPNRPLTVYTITAEEVR
jgi:hypothetical protein